MFGQFFKSIFQFCIYVILFIALVWVLLGIPPQEAYERTKKNLTHIYKYVGTFADNIQKTSEDMKAEGNEQLEDADARMKGHEPVLEKTDEALTQNEAE